MGAHAPGLSPIDAPEDDAEPATTHVDRLRVVITSIVERVGGLAAVQKLFKVFEEYDHAGGGLSANGLAYSALFALVPGILLVLAVVGLVINDPAIEEQIVSGISEAFPPLAPLVETAFTQVTAGAVPTTVVAVVGLLWGSSRFYAALDYAFSRLFRTSPRRNEIQRGVRGVVASIAFVALPLLLVIVGSLATWLMDLAPDTIEVKGVLRGLVSLGSPISTLILMIAGVAVVYRLVPNTRVPRQAYLLPAALAGTTIAIFTQIFTFIAPRMLHWAALFGALISVFGVLIWLSISLNVMLFGAAWTRVRLQDLRAAGTPADVDGGPEAGTEAASA
jgi:membrane protein